MKRGQKPNSTYVKYSDREIELIKKIYPKYGASGSKGCAAVIFKELGITRTRRAYALKARSLGALYQGEQKGVFQKGIIPHNKGKKMSSDVYKKVSKTFYKKGNEPHNTKYDGCLSYRKESDTLNYWYIRLSKSKWVLLQRYVYEQYYNVKLKSNQIVRFKDGNTSNLSIENLELISRTKNLLLNNPKTSYMTPELMEVIETLNKLKKAITDGKEQTNRFE